MCWDPTTGPPALWSKWRQWFRGFEGVLNRSCSRSEWQQRAAMERSYSTRIGFEPHLFTEETSIPSSVSSSDMYVS